MNLNAYDKITTKTAKSKIYNRNGFPYIVTREVSKRKYYCFVKRYEPDINSNSLYLVLLDDIPRDRQVARVRQDDYGRFKFNLSIIKSEFDIPNDIKGYVELTLDASADDGDIYKIEFKSD